jgi:hypothetical protein
MLMESMEFRRRRGEISQKLRGQAYSQVGQSSITTLYEYDFIYSRPYYLSLSYIVGNFLQITIDGVLLHSSSLLWKYLAHM